MKRKSGPGKVPDLSIKLAQISRADQTDAVVSIPLVQIIRQVTCRSSEEIQPDRS
jgi:hypothetical protein